MAGALPLARCPRLFAAAVLAALTLLTRAWDFGNPVIHVDEQFYLLVGDRMLHGAMPYLDIWDRKPIGLFALYALIRTLPGDGILAYQLVAAAFALATAWVVRSAARRVGASETAALAAGAAYLIWLPLLGGRGGQSPVFYNLPMAIAAYLTLGLPALSANTERGAILRRGLAVCLLGGIAIQFKYVPAFEGAWFGLAHLYYYRKAGADPARTIAAGLAWVAAALAPSLAAALYYRALGPAAFHAFVFANFTSIFLRPPYPFGVWAMRLLGIAAQLSPLLLAAGWIVAGLRQRNPVQRIAIGWLGFAVGGFLLMGTFFDHYALPLIAPLAIVAAPALDRSRRALAATLSIGLALFAIERSRVPNDGPGAREVARIVRANMRDGCPYVFMGDTITYHLAGACLPSRYAFPNYLAYSVEDGAAGIDAPRELARVLATRPPVIVAVDRRLEIWNRASLAELKPALARDYRLVARVPRANYRTLVYLRNDLPLRR